MLTVKPVHGSEPLWRARSLTNGLASRALSGVLGAATQHVPATPFEQALREAIAGLRASMARVEAEADPLTKHLGFRALNREVEARGLDGQQLSRPDDQAYAHELLQTARGREAQSFAALDDAARLDLEVLLHLEERFRARDEASASRTAATHQSATEYERAERLQRELDRQRASTERLPDKQRPAWLRLLGVALALGSLTVLGGLLSHPLLLGEWADGLPALRWSTALGALGLSLLGAWLSLDPQRRRAWLLAQVQQLTVSQRDAKRAQTHAAEALARARKLFEQIDDECRREEAAAVAVLQRRPGAQRYVRTSETVVVVPVQ
jgi:hypothetical protein